MLSIKNMHTQSNSALKCRNNVACKAGFRNFSQDAVHFTSRYSAIGICAEDFVKKFHSLRVNESIFCKECEQDAISVGKGATATVYKIPFKGFEKYLLKKINNLPDYLRDHPQKVFSFAQEKINPEHEIYKCLNNFEGRNFGEPVATIKGEIKDEVWILKKVDGEEICIDKAVKNKEDLKEIVQKMALRYQQLADMPQETYDKYAQDIKYINKKGFCLDPSSTNILIKDNKFNIIDLEKEAILNMWQSLTYNPPSTIFQPFFVIQSVNPLNLTKLTQQQNRNIVFKVLKASKKAGLEEKETTGIDDLKDYLVDARLKGKTQKILDLFLTPYSPKNTAEFCNYIDEEAKKLSILG